MEDSELSATERATRVVYRMMCGWTPTTSEVRACCEFNDDSGAWRLMTRISIEAPVYLDDDHKWRIVENAPKNRHYIAQPECD